MKLQVAIDMRSIEEALKLMEKIHPYVDIVEIGSPLVFCEGFRAVTRMKEAYPDKLILSDCKIVDGGYGIGSCAYDKGADIVTTIGLTNNETCEGLVRAAHERGKYAMADTIGVPNLLERIHELDEMGFDYILMHTASDVVKTDTVNAPIEYVEQAKEVAKRAKIGISGAITPSQLTKIISVNPDWIVSGRAITKAEDPIAVVKAYKQYMTP